MRLDDKMARIEQAMQLDQEHCACPGGWMVGYYTDDEPEPSSDGQVCSECGKPRGIILVHHVTGRSNEQTTK